MLLPTVVVVTVVGEVVVVADGRCPGRDSQSLLFIKCEAVGMFRP